MADHNRICDGAGDVERVARALCRRALLGVDEAYIDANWDRYADDARAAIAAMPVSAGREDVWRLLEIDMRRYVHDKDPDRRIKCLVEHTNRLAALSDDDGKDGR